MVVNSGSLVFGLCVFSKISNCTSKGSFMRILLHKIGKLWLPQKSMKTFRSTQLPAHSVCSVTAHSRAATNLIQVEFELLH